MRVKTVIKIMRFHFTVSKNSRIKTKIILWTKYVVTMNIRSVHHWL